jgi:spore maturation protein CgeB
MRIAVWGSSLVSAYWNGAATYYRGILRALANLGYEITFFEPDAYDRRKHRDIPDPDWARNILYDPADAEALSRHLSWSADCDFVVKASGVGVLDEELEARISTMPEWVCKVFWDVDAPATLARLAANQNDPFHAALPRFDLVLTYGGGQRVIDGHRSFGAHACHVIYNALDPDTHFAVPPDPRFACDLSFLGNRLPDRERRVERFFLSAAESARERRFTLGGNGWADKTLPSNVRYVGHVYTADHNAFNCSARMVLNISRDSMATNGYSPATRVFEAAGAAACLITDDWDGIEYFFEPGREILVAHSGEEVAQIVRELSEEHAREIGRAALKRVLADHTYAQRAALVDNTLKRALSRMPLHGVEMPV